MINITLCDDERAEIEYLSTRVCTWAAKRSIAVRLSSYASAESFLFAYAEDKSVDILLLDIQMACMGGVALARQIRRDNDRVQIIFVTGFPDYIAEGYDVSALHYLMKPVNEEKFYTVLDKAINQLSRVSPLLYLTLDGESVCIRTDEVVCIETFDHLLEITTIQKKHSVKMPLYELESMLTKDFIRCHRCYTVNMRYIKKITRKEVVLDSGRVLPLSRRLYPEVNKAMLRHLTGGVRP
jgi:DNA-binding LytR/AlgR family response regulator